MQDSGRFSTIRFNEWICLTAHYEKAIARLGKQVYQAYGKGLVEDHSTIQLCQEISQTFSEARILRLELEDEIERDALSGLNVEEAEEAAKLLKLSQAQIARRNIKVKIGKMIGKFGVNHSLASYRSRIQELSRELGIHAVNRAKSDALINVRGHTALCKLALQLEEDADKKWQEIVTSNKESGGGLSFYTTVVGFVTNFAGFSKNTYWGKLLLKMFKYDERQEQKKLSEQYEGSSSAAVLKAQMEEIDEPDLDISRELDNMQKEYQAPPEEWDVSPAETWGAVDESPQTSRPASTSSDSDTDIQFEGDVDDWTGGSDSWETDTEIELDFGESDDFFDALDGLDEPTETPEKAPPPAPTVLRKKSEPTTRPWSETPSVSMPPPSPTSISRPTISQPDAISAADQSFSPDRSFSPEPSFSSEQSFAPESPFASEPPPTPTVHSEPTQAPKFEEEDWGWGSFDDTPAATPPPPAPPAPDPAVLFSDDWSTSSDSSAQSSWGTSQWGSDTELPPTSNPTLDVNEDDLAPPTPDAPPPPPMVDQTLETMHVDLSGYDLESFSHSSGQSPVSEPVQLDDDDPLQRLLHLHSPAESTPPPPDPHDLGDDLLPAFLRERKDDTLDDNGDSFIPELPSFLEDDNAPSLEILPFGSTQSDDDDDDDDGPFIPSMPDL